MKRSIGIVGYIRRTYASIPHNNGVAAWFDRCCWLPVTIVVLRVPCTKLVPYFVGYKVNIKRVVDGSSLP